MQSSSECSFLHPLQNQEGILNLILGISFFVFSLILFLAWSYLREARGQAATQLRLDRCVGKVALEFRSRLNSIEKSNELIKMTRAAIVVAVEPSIRAALITTLKGEIILQETLLQTWKLREIQWLKTHGCGQAGDIALPVPRLPWTRDPPDFIGQQPLKWPEKIQKKFFIQVSHLPRHAAAEIKNDTSIGEPKNEISKWQAKWTPPLGFPLFPRTMWPKLN